MYSTYNPRQWTDVNHTIFSEILLIGFPNLQSGKTLFFLLLFFVYIGTISGNLLIIHLVANNRSLQSPMYFFLTQLSISDLLLTTAVVPNTLYIVWSEGGSISFSACIIQLYISASSVASECFLLSIMAYDRYLAICQPLRYSSLMSPTLCINLVTISWLLSFLIEMTIIMPIIKLDFCGPNIIDHFFCDLVPLIELSCSDIYFLELEIFIMCPPVTVSPLLIIVVSYTFIVLAILKISKSGRWKAFSTCSSHLIVVSIFYGTLIGTYLFPIKGQSLTVSKVISLLYTVFTPMINPIIYSLKNKDIKEAMKKNMFLHKLSQ